MRSSAKDFHASVSLKTPNSIKYFLLYHHFTDELAQGHTLGKWWGQEWQPGLPAPSVTTAERMRWRTHSKMLVLQDETRNSPFCLAILIFFFNYLINVKDLRVCHFYGLFVTD